MATLDYPKTQKNGISDYSYPLEHCTTLEEPKTLSSLIKFDHLSNNKVIIIIDLETQKNGISDYSYPPEHYTALGELKYYHL